MKILIACERFGLVRDAFIEQDHDAVSVDLVPSSLPGPHIVGDVRRVLYDGWDMLVAFPPCTYLSYAGAQLMSDPERQLKQDAAVAFFAELLNAPIEYIAIENPRGVIPTVIRKPDDCIQPYQFGHPFTKRTYLWLKNLPGLMATNIVTGPLQSWTDAVRSGELRSSTFPGIAAAMAAQWPGRS